MIKNTEIKGVTLKNIVITLNPVPVKQATFTKKSIAEDLGVTDRTIANYHTIAMAYIPDYMTHSKAGNGKISSHMPLDQYQRFCIELIWRKFQEFKSKVHVTRWLVLNAKLISEAAFTNTGG